MEWLKVEIRAEKEAAEAAAAILLEAGCQGAAFQSEGEMELIAGYLPYEEKMKDKVDRIAADIALFPKWGLGSAQVRTRVVRDEDWAESWKKFYRPVPIGAKLIICPRGGMSSREGACLFGSGDGLRHRASSNNGHVPGRDGKTHPSGHDRL